MNKECDLAYIVKHVRILRYFLRTVLDKDQRVLLKLKAKEYLDADNEKPNTYEFKRKTNKDLLLEQYIEFIQRKNLTKQDERLMAVLGFKDSFKLITDARVEKIQEKEMIDKSAFKGIANTRQEDNGDVALLGLPYIKTNTQTKRNPNAN